MEGKKPVGSSSFTDLFGSKEPQQTASSSTGVFASIFPPPSTVLGRSSNSEVRGSWQNQPSGNQEWNTKKESSAKNGKGVSSSKNDRTTYQEGRAEPCHLSSSLYYGGQDIYPHSSSTQTHGSYPIFKKDGEESEESNGNNSQSASRGNWWEGSLYY